MNVLFMRHSGLHLSDPYEADVMLQELLVGSNGSINIKVFFVVYLPSCLLIYIGLRLVFALFFFLLLLFSFTLRVAMCQEFAKMWHGELSQKAVRTLKQENQLKVPRVPAAPAPASGP